ncbi:hypothetical protein D9M70_591710 [compost metagenome]
MVFQDMPVFKCPVDDIIFLVIMGHQRNIFPYPYFTYVHILVFMGLKYKKRAAFLSLYSIIPLIFSMPLGAPVSVEPVLFF